MTVNNIPTQSTPFLGRQDELRQIDRLLADPACHLLTLVGPGGIGKTRLAIEAGVGAASTYPDGLYFVSLQPLTSAEHLVPAIADALHLQFFSGMEPQEQLFSYLCDKNLLLILDNLEHLLDSVGLIAEILAAAPDVKVLATSRERLNLLEEWVFDVGGLAYPADENETRLDSYSAVQLFTQHARRVRPYFVLNGESAAVVRICRFLEGMPLGIELAASWARTLSCQEIARQLEGGLDILATAARNMVERHRSMRAVLDYSWGLLSSEEQTILRRLSVFRGGFTLEAAEVMMGASLAALAALVDKSWLRGEPHSGRYDVHELLRQYGAERLEQSGDRDTAHDVHTEYYADFMGQREKDIKYQRQIPALNEIERDFDNIRAAWDWAAATCNDSAVNRMTEAMNFFCDMRARWPEGEKLFRRAMEQFVSLADETSRLTWSRLRARRVRMLMQGAIEETGDDFQAQLEDHISISRAHGDGYELAFGLSHLGILFLWQFDKSCLIYMEESFECYSELNDRFYMAQTLVYIGLRLWAEARTHEQVEVAKGFLQRSRDLSNEVGDKNEASFTACHMGRMAYTQGHYAEAESYFREAKADQRERGDMKGLSYSLLEESTRIFSLGEFQQACILADEGLEIVLRWNIVPNDRIAPAMVGMTYISQDRYEEAERLFKQTMSTTGSFMSPATMWALTGLLITTYQQKNPIEFRQYFQTMIEYVHRFPERSRQQNLPLWLFAAMAVLLLVLEGKKEWAVELLSRVVHLPQAVDLPVMRWVDKLPLFTRLREQLQTELGNVVYATAWERGKTLDLELTAQALLGDLSQLFQSPLQTDTLKLQFLSDPLTARELEILGLVTAGLSNREIAHQLVLTFGTVKWYVSQIYSKLGVNSRIRAVARARELKLLS